MRMSYARFLAMIATSTLAMFALMYLNTHAWDHVSTSTETGPPIGAEKGPPPDGWGKRA